MIKLFYHSVLLLISNTKKPLKMISELSIVTVFFSVNNMEFFIENNQEKSKTKQLYLTSKERMEE